jgi:hypothetical protein
MIFKPNTIDESYMQPKYLENIGCKKGKVVLNKKTINMFPSSRRRSGKKKKRR